MKPTSSLRMPASRITYSQCNAGVPNYVRPEYNAGAITWGAGDAYTCANPSASPASGAYIDMETVQGILSGSNTGGLPTLAISGRSGGAKPVLELIHIAPFRIEFSSLPSGTLTFRFVNTGGAMWLNGGANVDGPYTTTIADDSIAALRTNLINAFRANSTLTGAGIAFDAVYEVATDSYPLVVKMRTPQAGAMTLTYLSGPSGVNIIRMRIGVMQSGLAYNAGNLAVGQATFVFDILLQAWIYRRGGTLVTTPLEVMVDLCNRTNTNCWYNFPVNTKSAFITGVTGFFAARLTGQFGMEFANEIWNSSQRPYFTCIPRAAALSLFTGGNSSGANYSWAGLKTAQYGALSAGAWTGAGRSASDHYVLSMGQTGVSTGGHPYYDHQLNGGLLTGSMLTTYGGMNGATEIPRNTVGNRPVDVTNALGMAPYFGTWWWNGFAKWITGTVSDNAAWLQASKDYAVAPISTA